MVLGDIVFIFLALYSSYYLRFEGQIPQRELTHFMQVIIWIVPLKLVFLGFFNLYKGMWRYTGIHDLINLTKACITSSAIIIVLLFITVRFVGFPRSVFIIDLFLAFLFLGGFRVGVRLYHSRMESPFMLSFWRDKGANLKRLMIIGAGDSAEKLIREIMDNPNINYNVRGLIDDNPSKLKKTYMGSLSLALLVILK